MNYYKAIIQYDGTGYAGFQWQKDAPTIQDELNKALSKIISGKITTMGASRTDSGVHAFHQIVKITAENQINCDAILTLLNEVLPSSINCIAMTPCPYEFRPASDSLSKEYRYLFTNKSHFSAAERRFIANISQKLDLQAMLPCVQAIVGTHDFCNFVSTGSNVKSTLRTVNICELAEINPHRLFAGSRLFSVPDSLTHCYELRIEADGFLKQMIRHLVRSLWMVGSGKITTEQFLTLLNGPKVAKQLWRVAPASGLYLYDIKYRFFSA